MSAPLDPVYCRKCKKPIPSDQQFCGACGWDQHIIFDAEAERVKEQASQKAKAQKEREGYEARKHREAQEDQKAPTPDAEPIFTNAAGVAQNPYTMEEYTKQYATLNWYIAGALVGFFTGPIALALFIYALVQQNALRRRAAELGVNPDELSRAANARFWAIAAPLIKVLLKGVVLLVAIAGLLLLVAGVGVGGCKNGSTSRRDHDPLVAGVWFSSSGMARHEFSSDGTGETFETGIANAKTLDFNWRTSGNTLFWSIIDPRSGRHQESKYQYRVFTKSDQNEVQRPIGIELQGENGRMTMARP